MLCPILCLGFIVYKETLLPPKYIFAYILTYCMYIIDILRRILRSFSSITFRKSISIVSISISDIDGPYIYNLNSLSYMIKLINNKSLTFRVTIFIKPYKHWLVHLTIDHNLFSIFCFPKPSPSFSYLVIIGAPFTCINIGLQL